MSEGLKPSQLDRTLKSLSVKFEAELGRCIGTRRLQIRRSVICFKDPQNATHYLRMLASKLPKNRSSCSLRNLIAEEGFAVFSRVVAFFCRSRGIRRAHKKNTDKTGTSQLACFTNATTRSYHQSTSRTAVVGRNCLAASQIYPRLNRKSR
jgi:hypothetical protein